MSGTHANGASEVDAGEVRCASCGEVPKTVATAAPPGRSYRVEGMDCAEEVGALRRELAPLVGGEEFLAFDLLRGRLTLLPGARPVGDAEVLAAVRRTGLSARPWREGQEGARRRGPLLATVVSGLALLAGAVLHVVLAGGWHDLAALLAGHDGTVVAPAEVTAFGLAILVGGAPVAVRGLRAARALRADMNLLLTVAVIGAMAIGEWFEAAAVTFLFSLSLTLEAWSIDRARRAIAGLLQGAPPVAHVLEDGRTRTVAAAEVAPGTRFLVRPGERIPLDGVVVAGTSEVDQAPITGESVPVSKERGEEVYAGTINGSGALEVESTRRAEDTRLARVIAMVEQAQQRRARAEQWVERFAAVYTPAVMLLAVAVAVLPPLVGGGGWEVWFYRALVLLVIACPCALVISTPVSIVAALASAARHGVLVKGGRHFEAPARLHALAFDKTGTLTEGRPRVTAVVPARGRETAEVLACAAALEARSAHPLARAIVEYAEAQGVRPPVVTEVAAIPGRGVRGRIGEREVWLGSQRLARERGVADPEFERRAEALEAEGATVVLVGDADTVWGLVALADTLRPEAAPALAELHRLGVAPLVMLTGDNRATAAAIARAAGVDEFRAELLPEDKVAAVEELGRRHGGVAMVGDGVNDAPALAAADVGIAMGAIGSDAAIETADIALMTDDLSRLPWLVRHARRTLAVIRANITFALAVKAVFVGLTAVGMASLWGAIAADVGASLLVVANALRLLRDRRAGGD